MLNVKDNQTILCMYFQEGKSIRKISTELKINKRTVAKRIKDYEKIKSLSLEEIKADPQRVTDFLKNGSTYDSSNRKPSVLTPDIIALIAVARVGNPTLH